MIKRAVAVAVVGLGLFLTVVSFCAAAQTEPSVDSRLIDGFENGIDPHWETKSFKGQTEYTTEPCDTGHCLRALSLASASGLIYRLSFKVQEYPYLSWRWKVRNTLKKGDERTREGDDYSARVYVVFPHWFSPRTKVINYIWANKLSKGAAMPNSYFGNAVMIAVESGDENLGEWVAERRNLYADYREIFGEEPPPAGAVAVMTDTDNTGESALAWYDDIRLEK